MVVDIFDIVDGVLEDHRLFVEWKRKTPRRSYAYWGPYEDTPVLKHVSHGVIGFKTRVEAVEFKLRYAELVISYEDLNVTEV